MLVFSSAHGSISFHSPGGRRSLTLESQVSSVTPVGNDVVFFPRAKSSIRIAKAVDVNAFEVEAIVIIV
jgi:hypothetical protein